MDTDEQQPEIEQHDVKVSRDDTEVADMDSETVEAVDPDPSSHADEAMDLDSELEISDESPVSVQETSSSSGGASSDRKRKHVSGASTSPSSSPSTRRPKITADFIPPLFVCTCTVYCVAFPLSGRFGF